MANSSLHKQAFVQINIKHRKLNNILRVHSNFNRRVQHRHNVVSSIDTQSNDNANVSHHDKTHEPNTDGQMNEGMNKRYKSYNIVCTVHYYINEYILCGSVCFITCNASGKLTFVMTKQDRYRRIVAVWFVRTNPYCTSYLYIDYYVRF